MAKSASGLSGKANALLNWFDDRLPVTAFWNNVMTGYMAPKTSTSGTTWGHWPCWCW
jgi:hypothetical protein